MIRDLAPLRTLTMIASLGSFARAAEKLRISRALASRQISDLEFSLGTSLLNRTTRQLSLTEAGQTLLDATGPLLEGLDAAEEELRSMTRAPKGTLKISAPTSFGARHLGAITSEYLNLYPDVNLSISLDDRIVNIVENGFDLAIRITNLPDSSLVARKLGAARLVMCASPAYLAAHGTPTHPSELSAHQCLIYDFLPHHGSCRLEREGVSVEMQQVEGRVRANNGDVLLETAINGRGIVMLPTFICHDALRSGQLLPVLQDWKPAEPQIFAVMPPGRTKALKVKSFVDHLARRIGSDPAWDRNLPIT